MRKDELIFLLGEEGIGVYKNIIDSIPTKRVNNKKDLKELYLSALIKVLSELDIKIETSKIRFNTLDAIYNHSNL